MLVFEAVGVCGVAEWGEQEHEGVVLNKGMIQCLLKPFSPT
jgi:hypothetical protein